MIFNYRNDKIIINGRREKHFREINILEYISSKYNMKNTIIDCGANYGNHTVYLAKYTNCSRIFSFEPIPNIFKVLQENVVQNNIQNKVVCYNSGVSKKKKSLKLISKIYDTQGAFWFWYEGENYKHPADMGYGHLHRKNQSVENLMVESIPLDSKIDEFGKVDFIKIDVEGMEMEVLLGAEKLIKQNKPLLYIEACNGTRDSVAKWINENGYKKVKHSIFHGHHWLCEPI